MHPPHASLHRQTPPTTHRATILKARTPHSVRVVLSDILLAYQWPTLSDTSRSAATSSPSLSDKHQRDPLLKSRTEIPYGLLLTIRQATVNLLAVARIIELHAASVSIGTVRNQGYSFSHAALSNCVCFKRSKAST